MDRGNLWATIQGVTESDTTERLTLKREREMNEHLEGVARTIPGQALLLLLLQLFSCV